MFFFFSSRRRHTRFKCDWSSDVCSSDLNVKVIESTLETFGVPAKVVGVNPGPAVTQYELQPGAGVQVKRITALQNDLSLALAASPLRIEAPIPGKAAVGIAVTNESASRLTIR